jgi:hypothetical protein
MSGETSRPALPRFAWLKGWNPEKLLQWLAETAEDAIGLSYELSQIRAPNEDPSE